MLETGLSYYRKTRQRGGRRDSDSDSMGELDDDSDREDGQEETALPESVFYNIFSCLGARDLASVRLVCTEWKELSQDLWDSLDRLEFRFIISFNK